MMKGYYVNLVGKIIIYNKMLKRPILTILYASVLFFVIIWLLISIALYINLDFVYNNCTELL